MESLCDPAQPWGWPRLRQKHLREHRAQRQILLCRPIARRSLHLADRGEAGQTSAQLVLVVETAGHAVLDEDAADGEPGMHHMRNDCVDLEEVVLAGASVADSAEM